MRNGLKLVVAALATCVLVSGGRAQSGADGAEVQRLLDSLKVVEAPVFSPKAYEKAKAQFDMGEQSVSLKRGASTVAGYFSKAREYGENALKNTDVCKLSLREYLPGRTKARVAKAPTLVPVLYDKAEAQFIAAAAKVESGDVKGGLKEAAKSTALYDVAEMEAIRVDVLGGADKLIATATADEAPKYALTILDKARTAREKANGILTANRYNRTEATKSAMEAEYEARHASNISQSVRSLNRNDQAWEKLMLLYEIQMDRAGQLLGIDHLPFDQGPSRAADSLIAGIQALRSSSSADVNVLRDSLTKLGREMEEMTGTREQLRESLMSTLVALGGDTTIQSPMGILQAIDSIAAGVATERSRLSEQVAVEQSKLTQLSEEHREVTTALQGKEEREQRLMTAKSMIDPTQGEMFVNASNDIVLRLSGLSFAAGKSEIVDQQLPLLEKVKQIIGLFPESPLVIEGHTDDRGEPAANTQLSEKRAFAVMQYLRQTMNISSDRIRAIGYGSEKPIASQSTPEGRAKNRRIDILIMQ